ncbi:hypothetical protein C8T65DRAFT_651010 [Cerioporus squamosus]|nr:hypothetical protein C8T65DRAFT_651010 [Cerioporus squamosus]
MFSEPCSIPFYSEAYASYPSGSQPTTSFSPASPAHPYANRGLTGHNFETSIGQDRRRRPSQEVSRDSRAGATSEERRKGPCVQCAQAGVPNECSQNRRTIGCARCNAQRLGCSYRTGVVASSEDLDMPQVIRNINNSLAILLENSRQRSGTDGEQSAASQRATDEWRLQFDRRLERVEEELGELKGVLREFLFGETSERGPTRTNASTSSSEPTRTPVPSHPPLSSVPSPHPPSTTLQWHRAPSPPWKTSSPAKRLRTSDSPRSQSDSPQAPQRSRDEVEDPVAHGIC